MSRKGIFAGMDAAAPAASGAGTPSGRVPPLPFAGRGAPGALTRSIDDLARKANAAEDLEARLKAGQVIVELDAATIDPSFVTDRMVQDDEAYQALRTAIAANGQNSPILVRPHPTSEGRFQVAFGHRRLRVAQELGKPVRAVVRTLSDQELIIAQGQENSARADLSFVERARFAQRLENLGYGREVIMAALAVDKTTVSRMIAVTTRIPGAVIDAIGPAPGTGRSRWVELAGRFEVEGRAVDISPLLADEDFRKAGSDDRFNLLAAFVESGGNGRVAESENGKGRGLRQDAQQWAPPGGERLVTVTHSTRSSTIAIDRRLAPGFGDFILGQMDRLYSDYMAARPQASLMPESVKKRM